MFKGFSFYLINLLSITRLIFWSSFYIVHFGLAANYHRDCNWDCVLLFTIYEKIKNLQILYKTLKFLIIGKIGLVIENRIFYINLTSTNISFWLNITNTTLGSFMELANAIALLTPRTALVAFASIARIVSPRTHPYSTSRPSVK